MAKTKIVGIEGLTGEQVAEEVAKGGRFVFYLWCASGVVLTIKRPTSIYFIRAGESRLSRGLLPSFMTLLLGWWGIPWGPIYTIQSLVTNFRGGRDITDQIARAPRPSGPPPVPSINNLV